MESGFLYLKFLSLQLNVNTVENKTFPLNSYLVQLSGREGTKFIGFCCFRYLDSFSCLFIEFFSSKNLPKICDCVVLEACCMLDYYFFLLIYVFTYKFYDIFQISEI